MITGGKIHKGRKSITCPVRIRCFSRCAIFFPLSWWIWFKPLTDNKTKSSVPPALWSYSQGYLNPNASTTMLTGYYLTDIMLTSSKRLSPDCRYHLRAFLSGDVSKVGLLFPSTAIYIWHHCYVLWPSHPSIPTQGKLQVGRALAGM